MYLPALTARTEAAVTAVCGRDPFRTAAFASRWGVPHAFSDPIAMLDSGLVEAVVIATPNDTHHDLATAAVERGFHVLCEKPLALNHVEAEELARAAEAAGVTTLVPFTYRFMPTTRFVKRLLEDGYIGRPHHLSLRYYSGWAIAGGYQWRFDMDRAGSGALGDLGSHFLHLAEWFFGEIGWVSCELGRAVERPHPEGRSYRQADDHAVLVLGFTNGAMGVVHVSAVAAEPTPFGQVHEMDLHGSEGTIHHRIDWDRTQVVLGARVGEDALCELEVPEEIWGGAPRGSVKETYHHVFRNQGHMVGDWVRAATARRPVRPDLADGARVQRVLDAALLAAERGCRVRVDDLPSLPARRL
jgi:predicted dehydrogenase